MDSKDVEALRASYRPTDIKVLFVGESAPAGGNFFNKETGQTHENFKKVLSPHIGDQPTFIDAFRRAGFFLDDLVLKPVNWETWAARTAMQKGGVPSLAARIRRYNAPYVVAFLKGIEEPVQEAIEASKRSCEFDVVPFPGNGRQLEFRSAMEELLPKLLTP